MVVLAIVIGCITWVTYSRLSCEWGEMVLSSLVDVSAILFGVFGIWLGMFYRPDICDEPKGKANDELKNTCRKIISNAERFDIVFRGVKTSAVVLVFSMGARTIKTPVLQFVTCDTVRHVFKWFVVYGIYWSVLFQAYAVIMAIAPMRDAKQKMQKAKRDAEDTLAI